MVLQGWYEICIYVVKQLIIIIINENDTISYAKWKWNVMQSNEPTLDLFLEFPLAFDTVDGQ